MQEHRTITCNNTEPLHARTQNHYMQEHRTITCKNTEQLRTQNHYMQ